MRNGNTDEDDEEENYVSDLQTLAKTYASTRLKAVRLSHVNIKPESLLERINQAIEVRSLGVEKVASLMC